MRTGTGVFIVAAVMLSLMASLGSVLYGCAGRPDSQGTNSATGAKAPPASHTGGGEPVSTVIDARPAALINGKAISWADLRPALSELAGAEALQELALDRQIESELAAKGFTMIPDHIAAEQKLLLESLDGDPNRAIDLLNELRERQKLGKHRFETLLRRNAGLRALVKDSVRITDEALRNMHELVHGPKRQPRLMVLRSLEDAQAAINLVNTGVNFADVAVEMSIDSSAPRGGLLEPISRVDPAYPESLRQTLWTLNPGEMSGPVMIDDRYAVVMLVKRIAGDSATIEESRPALQRLVRVQQERLFMDQLARRLLAETQITVFDESLHESWTKRRR